MQKLRPAALALSAVVLLAGCSGSDDEPEAEAAESTDSAATPTESLGADGKPAKQKRNESWTLSAGEPMTKKQVNYLAVCVQWDGFQDGVPWHDGIWEKARDSENELAFNAVGRMNREIREDGEPSDETIALMDDVCADVDR